MPNSVDSWCITSIEWSIIDKPTRVECVTSLSPVDYEATSQPELLIFIEKCQSQQCIHVLRLFLYIIIAEKLDQFNDFGNLRRRLHCQALIRLATPSRRQQCASQCELKKIICMCYMRRIGIASHTHTHMIIMIQN